MTVLLSKESAWATSVALSLNQGHIFSENDIKTARNTSVAASATPCTIAVKHPYPYTQILSL